MTLPSSRTVTLAPGAQVPSDLINEIQDNIVGGKHGVVTKMFGTEIVIGGVEAFNPVDTYYIAVVGADDGAFFGIPLVVGDRLISINAHLRDDVGATQYVAVQFRFIDWANGTVVVPTGSVAVNSAADGSDQAVAVNMGTGGPYTIAAGHKYYVTFDPNANGNYRFYGLAVTYDHP